MSEVRFELDKAGFRKAVLQSQEMLSLVTSKAQARSDSKHHIKPFIGSDRAKAIIYPNTKENPS